MKGIKTFIAVILIQSLLLTTMINGQQAITLYYEGKAHPYDLTDVKIIIDGNKIEYNGMPPVVIEDRTLVPVREVMESASIGASVEWDASSQKVTIVRQPLTLELFIGSEIAFLNGSEIEMDTKAMLIRKSDEQFSKTMVPLRFICEIFGYSVKWESETHNIIITTPIRKEEPEPMKPPTPTENETSKKSGYINPSILQEQLKAMTKQPIFKLSEPYAANLNHISEADKAKTFIRRITYFPYQEVFNIRANSPMSTISYYELEGRLVFDLTNVDLSRLGESVNLPDNDYVALVRCGTPSTDPLVSRLVFDLKPGVKASMVDIYKNREQIDIVFQADVLDEIGFGKLIDPQGTVRDYAEWAVQASDIRVSYLENPLRCVVDLENVVTPFYNQSVSNNYDRYVGDYNGQYISRYRIAQFNESTTRIVFDLKQKTACYPVKQADGRTTLIIGELAPDQPATGDIFHPDNQLFTLVGAAGAELKMDYAPIYKKVWLSTIAGLTESQLQIKAADKIRSYQVKEGKLIIGTDHIYQFFTKTVGQDVEVYGLRPKDLYDRIVLIDTGHGGTDPGAVYEPVMEKVVNLKIFNYMMKHLPNSNIRYYYTRTDDQYISLDNRAEMANDLQADLFVSIHNNAVDLKRNPTGFLIRGTEVYVTNNQEHSKQEHLFGDLFRAKIKANPKYVFRSVTNSNKLFVLRNTLMTSAIIEYGYTTSPLDVELITDEAVLEDYAIQTLAAIEQLFATK